jgi:hypothetical protein
MFNDRMRPAMLELGWAVRDAHNVASRSVMRRLGLRDAGVIVREGFVAGRAGLHPDAPFALYRND